MPDKDQSALEREFSEYASIIQTSEEIGADMQELMEAVRIFQASKSSLDALRSLANEKKYSQLVKRITEVDLEMAQAERLLTKALREVDNLDREKLDLERENRRLQDRIWEFESNQSKVKLLKQPDGLYYKDDGEGPFCKTCSEDIQRYVDMKFVKSYYRCPKCRGVSYPA